VLESAQNCEVTTVAGSDEIVDSVKQLECIAHRLANERLIILVDADNTGHNVLPGELLAYGLARKCIVGFSATPEKCKKWHPYNSILVPPSRDSADAHIAAFIWMIYMFGQAIQHGESKAISQTVVVVTEDQGLAAHLEVSAKVVLKVGIQVRICRASLLEIESATRMILLMHKLAFTADSDTFRLVANMLAKDTKLWLSLVQKVQKMRSVYDERSGLVIDAPQREACHSPTAIAAVSMEQNSC
jgi:hypothetical protein